MLLENFPCPLCNSSRNSLASGYSSKTGELMVSGTCEICGELWISAEAISDTPKKELHLLSAYFRKLRDERVKPERIFSSGIKQLLADLPRYSVEQKIQLLLTRLGDVSKYAGQLLQFDPVLDYPIAYGVNESEAAFFISALIQGGHLVQGSIPSLEEHGIRASVDDVIASHTPDPDEEEPEFLAITVEGWREIQRLKSVGKNSSRAFIAMWFNDEMDDIYENGIKPAVLESGYLPERVDRLEFINRIDDEIIARLKDARFVIADYTGHRHGVYFEAGFGWGAGKTVIGLCKKNHLEGLHFDTRQYNMIDYSDVDELRTRLLNRILAVEGRGPERKQPS
jgi:hypothetical protein